MVPELAFMVFEVQDKVDSTDAVLKSAGREKEREQCRSSVAVCLEMCLGGQLSDSLLSDGLYGTLPVEQATGFISSQMSR